MGPWPHGEPDYVPYTAQVANYKLKQVTDNSYAPVQDGPCMHNCDTSTHANQSQQYACML